MTLPPAINTMAASSTRDIPENNTTFPLIIWTLDNQTEKNDVYLLSLQTGLNPLTMNKNLLQPHSSFLNISTILRC